MNFNDPFAHGAYLVWDGGALKFDTCDEEDIDEDADVVEHPVETGSNVTDHYRIKPRVVKLTAFVSQEPVDPSLYPEANGSVQAVELSLPPYPHPSPGQLAAVGAFAQNLTAPRPPTTFNQSAFVYSSPIDTLAKVLSVFDDLRANATLIDVATVSRYYAQHLLATYSTRRNEKTGTGTIIELELRQVFFVSTDAVAAPPTPKKPKDKPGKNKGKQNPTTGPIQSVAIGLLKLAGVL